MNVEHWFVFHGFRKGAGESHKQDGETLPAQQSCNASRDPAMAFGLSLKL
jgi:hypothetical protein